MGNDDHRDDTIPAPDTPASELEQERAASFGDLVDGMLTGLPSPPAMRADERVLIEVASVVRVVAGDRSASELDATRRDELIDAALRSAVSAEVPAEVTEEETPGEITSLAAHRLQRTAPWVLTAVFAAAALLFALRPLSTTRPTATTAQVAPATRLSTDQLVGRIHKNDAGDASSRIDLIYTDRLALYRRARLGGLR